MSLGSDNTLPLEFNGFVEATFELLLAESSFMTKAKLLKHVQNVCIMYACLGVKRNDGCVGEKAKHKDAAEAYREVVVPFFLRWAKENSVKLPTWLTFDMLGRSTMTGAPTLFKNGDRLWARFNQGLREMKKYYNPIWDRFVRGQPGGKLPSGLVHGDALENLLNGLYHTTTGTSDSPVSLEEEALFARRTAGGRGGSPVAATDGVRLGGGAGRKEKEKKQDDGGAAEEKDEGKAATCEGGGIKQEPAEGGGGRGRDSEEDPSLDEEPELYPERPDGWVHQFTLIFCLIGRPSSSEDVDLGTARSRTRPPGRAGKRKAPSSDDDDIDGVLSPEEGSGGILNSDAIRMFAGAGEAQSRVKVKDEVSKLNERNAQLSNQAKIAGAVENLAAIVGRREVLDQETATLARESAARDRKADAIQALRGELEFTAPGTMRYDQIREQLVRTFATPVSDFASRRAPPTSAATNCTPTALSVLPGFTNDGGGDVGGGGAGCGGGGSGAPAGGGTHWRRI